MATLVSDLITEAFLDLGLISPGQSITTEEQTDAFLRLNQMLASWSTEHTSVFTEQHGSFNLTAGTDGYTMGPSGTFSTSARPVKICGVSAASGLFRVPVKLVSWEDFHALVSNDRGVTSILPQALAADNGYPLLSLKVFPMPAAGAGTLDIDYWTPLSKFSTVSDTVDLPPGFEEALHFNLAVRLYPQYSRNNGIDQALLLNAQNSKAGITALTASVLGNAAQPIPAQPAAKPQQQDGTN
jgi:hypothetical protein